MVGSYLRRWMCAVLAFGLVVLPLSAHCQIYVGASAGSGTIVLSNFLSPETPDALLVVDEISISDPQRMLPRPAQRNAPSVAANAVRLRQMIDSVATSVNVAPRLIHAVIAAESNYEPRAVSHRGAIGLMQLMPDTARRFGIRDPFVERDNVLAGASYLKWLMRFFNGDLELVLAAYNAGETAVVKAGRKVPQYPETQNYVRRIMADLHSTGSIPL